MKRLQLNIFASTSGKGTHTGGFTLIELLIAIAMFSFVLLLVATTFIQINRSYTAGLTTKRVHEETRVALSSITADFRTASSGANVEIYCDGPGCENDLNTPTEILCYDSKAFVFNAPSSGTGGRLGFVEDVNCSDPDGIKNSDNISQFSDLLQPQFFRVTEVVDTRTYRIELIVSTAAHTNDLLEITEGGDSIRDLACDPSEHGGQYCNVVTLTSVVSLRSN